MAQQGDTRPNCFADDMDQLLIAGASVEEAAEKSVAVARARGVEPMTPALVRQHLKFRTDRGWQLHSLPGGRVQLVPPPWHRLAQSDITQEQAQASTELLRVRQQEIPALPADAADEEPFDPSNISDARQRALRAIAQRRGQKAFRDALVTAYDSKCVVSSCTVRDVLEAAHI
jgi:hypothetical protein